MSQPSVDEEWRAELLDAFNSMAVKSRDPGVNPNVEMSPGTALLLGKLAAKIAIALAERRKKRDGTRAITADPIDVWWEDVLEWFANVGQMMTNPVLRPIPVPIPPPPKPPAQPPELVP